MPRRTHGGPVMNQSGMVESSKVSPVQDPKGTMSYRTEGGISVRPWGQGLSKGRQGPRGEKGWLECIYKN